MYGNIVLLWLVATAFAALPTLAASANPCGKGCKKISSRSHQVIVVPDPSTNETWPYQKYRSSKLEPPYLEFEGNLTALDPDYLFFDSGSYALIMENNGQLVYGLLIDNGTRFLTDIRVQYYQGNPHLTVWNGVSTIGLSVGHGYGEVAFFDQEYNMFQFNPKLDIVSLVTPTPPGIVDLHEHQIDVSETSVVITSYNNTPADLTAFGRKHGWVVDSLIFDIDVATQEVLFSWNPHDHGVPYSASHVPLNTSDAGNGTKAAPWDWCHINSGVKVGNNYLINSRHLWKTWFVNGTNGDIIWTFDGATGGDFGPLPNGAVIDWQHYARAYNVSDDSITLSIFNNHNNADYVKDPGPTTGYLLKFALPPNKSQSPQVLRNLSVSSDPLYVGSQGSYTPYLNNSNHAFMGYGQSPTLREYAPTVIAGHNQTLLGQWTFGLYSFVQSYRGFKFPWSATPAGWNPHIVLSNSTTSGNRAAYVSWNGATEVTAWNVYAGAQNSSLKFIGQAAKHGFETTFNISSALNCVQVNAVQGGQQVRKSNVACV